MRVGCILQPGPERQTVCRWRRFLWMSLAACRPRRLSHFLMGACEAARYHRRMT
ncbi:hypothetical protein GWL_39450 [Herbaspirillum sp. GW103]|nr:hypothetical protein GWL_39450 [Herbaspirillum sp. GW103]